MLFKYLPPERIDVVSNRRIRFSQPAALNDIFEANPVISNLADNTRLKNTSDAKLRECLDLFWSSSPELHSQVKYVDYISAGMNRLLMNSALNNGSAVSLELAERKRHKMVNANIGILSLSERADNEVMWASYGANHTGFALGFDSSHEYFSKPFGEALEYRKLHKVSYSVERPFSDIFGSTELSQFLVKADHWRYEEEWRMIMPLSMSSIVCGPDASGFPVHLFDFPLSSVKQLVFGSRATVRLQEIVTELFRQLSQIEILRCVPKTHSFGLSVIPK